MASLSALCTQLRLPNAKLSPTLLTDEALQLYLLELDNPELSLSASEIAHFWQRLPYWAFAWAGGRALARWIAANKAQIAGKRVLDFGTGSGIVAIACALAGAQEVWAADLDQHALLATKLNAKLNGVEIKTVQGDWPQVDLLLASDVLYDLSSSADLQQLMLRIPSWVLAESQYVKPQFVALTCLARYSSATLPAIGDFDQQVEIEIYTRSNASVNALI